MPLNIRDSNFANELQKIDFYLRGMPYSYLYVDETTGFCLDHYGDDIRDRGNNGLDLKVPFLVFWFIGAGGSICLDNPHRSQLKSKANGTELIDEIRRCVELGVKIATNVVGGSYIPFDSKKFLNQTPLLSNHSIFQSESKHSRESEVIVEEEAVGPEEQPVGPGF
jgi:hypothetical protein